MKVTVDKGLLYDTVNVVYRISAKYPTIGMIREAEELSLHHDNVTLSDGVRIRLSFTAPKMKAKQILDIFSEEAIAKHKRDTALPSHVDNDQSLEDYLG